MKGWTLFWLVWVATGVAAEAIALAQPLGATLSQQVWWLRQSLPGRVLLWSFLLWAIWHWLIEPEGLWRLVRDDLAVIAVGIAVGLSAAYRVRRHRRTDD